MRTTPVCPTRPARRDPPATPPSGAAFDAAAPPLSTVAAQWLATRINYICDHHRDAKPRHREPSKPVPQPLGGEATFCVGRFLSQLAEYHRQGRQAELGAAGERLLAETTWFRAWLDKLVKTREAARCAVQRPDTSEELELLVAAFPSAAPAPEALAVEVTRSNGERYALSVPKVLERIGIAYTIGKSDLKVDAIKAFHALPWAAAWVRAFVQRRRTAAQRLIVTKDVKTHLLLLNCPRAKPTWDLIVPVCGAGMEGVYRWRPASWLDDVAGNWTGQTPSVRLGAHQMRAIETLPWVAEWLDGVHAARERKRKLE